MNMGLNKRQHCYLDEHKRARAPEVSIKGHVKRAVWCNRQRTAGFPGLQILWLVGVQVSAEER